MKIAILAPIHTSLYSRLITYLAIKEPGITVSQIVVRKIFNWQRIKGELRRDGHRLIQKVYKKLILEEISYLNYKDSIASLVSEVNLPGNTLNDLAKQFEIPLLFVKDHNDQKAVDNLKELNLDAVIFTGGGLIRKDLLGISKFGVINCHAGLLPPYRGMDVVEWAILEAKNSQPKTGLTLHIMDKGVDTGPILKTHLIKIQKGDSIDLIRERLEPAMIKIMLDGLREIRDGKTTPIYQVNKDGKQYFVMHPRLRKMTTLNLKLFS